MKSSSDYLREITAHSDPHYGSEKLRELEKELCGDHHLLIEGLWDSPKALIAAMILRLTNRPVVLVTGRMQEELYLHHDLPYFSDAPILDYPAWETLPSENIPPSPDIVGQRLTALHHLNRSDQPCFVIVSLQALLQKVITPSVLDSLCMQLTSGMALPREQFIHRLQELGYTRRSIVGDKGEFSLHGEILDLFPVSSPDPFRLIFSSTSRGDVIESIRSFDPVGQKSIDVRFELLVTPAEEGRFLDLHSSPATLLDYVGRQATVLLDDMVALEERYTALCRLLNRHDPALLSIESLLSALGTHRCLYLTDQRIESLSDVRHVEGPSDGEKLSFHFFKHSFMAKRIHSPFMRVSEALGWFEEGELLGDELLSLLAEEEASSLSIRLICPTEREEESLRLRIESLGVDLPPGATFERHYLSSGFGIKDSDLLLFPITEVTQRHFLRRQKQRSSFHSAPTEVFHLQIGDFVVHSVQGIGKFRGVEMRKNHQGIDVEFLRIDYANQGVLYVPLHQAHLVSKYVGAGEGSPRLHKLGEGRWKRIREKTEREIQEYASQLMELYARRQAATGFIFDANEPKILEFEESFPYRETEDQLQAIADVRTDMCSPLVMDRLICGDVGYGKTEVAMRAAFRAVVGGGKQVAVLVPTTILAMQHYETFLERMSGFGIRVAVLSRFVTAKQIRESLQLIASGEVDIVIGTHRVISKDVIFKDLGLVLIDEEQRFGVKAKEALKQITHQVDCITLSATPIPRTLYMSMIGARDMSVINTPPQDRVPIKSVLTQSSDEVIRTALSRELLRNGQAFVIHNRVETIFEYASHIQELVPDAKIVVAHGQMDSKEIDEVFHAFKKGAADILVSTTIVESGIDIPNANTILIDHAERFGLSDLYQLRGRVGRWSRKAYAYFMVPSLDDLSEVSRKRLSALVDTSGYGGGMKIAMCDLEIRGAGSFFGEEQSGFLSNVGFHLYCKMLKRAVSALKGEISPLLCDSRVDLPIDARLPEEYIDSVSVRMEFYQRFGDAVSNEEIDALMAELEDRFGSPPPQAKNLARLSRLRVYCSRNGIEVVKYECRVLLAQRKFRGETSSCQVPVELSRDAELLETQVMKHLKDFFPGANHAPTQHV